MDVNIFDFDDNLLAALETSLSPERMATYVQATGGDRARALQFYTWNTAVSAAFYGPLQGLEVALRNAMHRQLSAVYGENWFDNPCCGLDAGGLNRIDGAKSDLRKGGYALDSPHVIAALPFGFWVSLLGRGGQGRAPDTGKKNYDMTLWRKAIYKAFPYGNKNRVGTHKPLDYLRTLRNRIAHHEPIFSRHLEADFRSILQVTGWICPATADWIKQHSRVDDILQCERSNGGTRF